MFKTTGSSGHRASGSGGTARPSRVSAGTPVRVSTAPGPRTVAFMPETPQEHGFDANSGRLGGLENRKTGLGHN